jgi:hypothetical protein
MSRHARAALAAAVVVAAFALAPAQAGERATLKVSARVVDRCTIEVPRTLPPGPWHERAEEFWGLVRHECGGGRPIRVQIAKVLVDELLARVRADKGLRAFLEDQLDGARVDEARHPTRRDVMLITITY